MPGSGAKLMRMRHVVTVSLLGLAACAPGPDGEPVMSERVATGALVGAILGGAAGAAIDDNEARGIALGAAAGALAGGLVGYMMDEQERRLRAALAAERSARIAEVERLEQGLVRVTFTDEVMFDFDSASIRPGFRETLRRLADALAACSECRVLVVGHTDSVGSAAYNLELSRRRAEAVRAALIAYGVRPEQITAEGRGEMEPRADNATEAGRQLNRRVEIYITPVRV